MSSYRIVSMSVSVVYSIILLSAVIVLGNSYFVFWLRSGSRNICATSGIKKHILIISINVFDSLMSYVNFVLVGAREKESVKYIRSIEK